MSDPIEVAKDFDSAIEIISEEDCEKGIYFLQYTLVRLFAHADDFSLVPIKNGGTETGERLADPAESFHYDLNPMQMSNYDDKDRRLEEPRLIHLPDLNMILKPDGTTKDVVFAEAVVDSQSTILKSIEEINRAIDDYNHDHGTNYAHPAYHTFALVNKVNGDTQIPGLIYAYHVDHRIWVYGRGCDSGEQGREVRSIKGSLSPYATTTPDEPYLYPNPELTDMFNH